MLLTRQAVVRPHEAAGEIITETADKPSGNNTKHRGATEKWEKLQHLLAEKNNPEVTETEE